MEIPYKGIITKKDFSKCILLLNPNLKWQRWFCGTVLGTMIFSFVYLWAQGATETVKSILELGPVSFIFVPFLLYPWWVPYLQLAAYDQKANIYRNEVFGIINDREVTIGNHEVNTTLQWSFYSGYTIDKELLLLRLGKSGFNAFKPGMFTSADDWNKFITLVKNKISSK